MSNIKIQSFDGSSYSQLLPQNSASLTTYSNTQTGISATNVQDAIDSCFTSVSNGKSLIASAITDMGVSTGASDSFSVMAENIKQISQNIGQSICVRRDYTIDFSTSVVSYSYNTDNGEDRFYYAPTAAITEIPKTIGHSTQVDYRLINYTKTTFYDINNAQTNLARKYVYTNWKIGIPHNATTPIRLFKVINSNIYYSRQTGMWYIDIQGYQLNFTYNKMWEVYKEAPVESPINEWVRTKIDDTHCIVRIFDPKYW